MKMVYLFNHYEVLEDTHIGIRKKMFMQMKSFKKLGYEPMYVVFDENKVVIKDMVSGTTDIHHYARLSDVYGHVLTTIRDIHPEFIYMRYRMIYTPSLYRFYEELGKMGNKVICEFYTYPYDTEFAEDDPDIVMDRYYSRKLNNIFHLSTNYNGYNEILGIPSLSISNGIDMDSLPIATVPENTEQLFRMICVSTMFPWHGYDRIIEGIHDYYEKGNAGKVEFHLIGDGKEKTRYLSLVERYGLQENVFFHGKISNSDELNRLFDGMDLAIGSVGMHRLNLRDVSPIKSAEYCARGIPFVVNYSDISFDKEVSFIDVVSMDETPVDIAELIAFAKKNRNVETTKVMREYAEARLTWDAQMSKVLQFADLIGEKKNG